MTSTSVETITETIINPTNVISTITSTILQSIPTSYENEASDDSIDSIFVVMSDQKPPEPGAEEVINFYLLLLSESIEFIKLDYYWIIN